MNVLGYVRVSTDKQAKFGASIDAQERNIRDYCARLGLTLTEIVGDEAVSGTIKFSERPGGARIKAALTEGKAEGVVAAATDRLGRDADDIMRVQRAIIGAGFQLHTIESGRITLDNFGDRVVAVLRAEIAQEDRAKIAVRTQAAMDQRFIEGRPTGRVPMTALVEIDSAGVKRLVDNPVMLRAAKMAAELRAGGMSLRAIGTALTEAGYHPPVPSKGKPRLTTKWHPPNIESLIMQAEGWRGCHGVNRAKAKAGKDLLADL